VSRFQPLIAPAALDGVQQSRVGDCHSVPDLDARPDGATGDGCCDDGCCAPAATITAAADGPPAP
jgi:hypothetical protein